MTRRSTSRRDFLAGSLAGAAVLLTGCSDKAARSSATVDQVLLKLTPSDGRVAAGVPDRIPLAFGDATGQPIRTAGPEYLHVQVSRLTATGDPEQNPIASIDVACRGPELPYPYYPLELTFPAAGYYELNTELEGQTHTTTIGVVEANQAQGALPGDHVARFLESPSNAPPCSQWPGCDLLHAQSLEQFLAMQQPFALVLLTPAACHSAPCQQLLDMAIDVTASTGVAGLHAEVIEPGTFTSASPTPTPLANSLIPGVELAVLAIASDGRIASRLDAIFDRTELAETLSVIR